MLITQLLLKKKRQLLKTAIPHTGGRVLSCLPFSAALNIYIFPLGIFSKSIASEGLKL
jgi:hypothetical protein